MKVSAELYRKINELLDEYTLEVKNAGLKESAETTYLRHANNFVRWCNGEFTPGGNLKKVKHM
ncbi:hypothetical protein [Paenibacillus macerans]|uniref:hypothetical protein n=1 Tax=Paenibacillus macerans TaxID=44252 RepID=UPI0022E060A4|nr:hypothetical protein [Paenibacillus macerans]